MLSPEEGASAPRTPTYEVIDTLVTEQAVGAMALLQERGEEIGWPRLEGTVQVGEHTVPGLYFGEELQARHYGLVDRTEFTATADTCGA